MDVQCYSIGCNSPHDKPAGTLRAVGRFGISFYDAKKDAKRFRFGYSAIDLRLWNVHRVQAILMGFTNCYELFHNDNANHLDGESKVPFAEDM